MRFVSLDLLAFGGFTDRRLDFSQPGPCLHLIYGPNEAGKSTTLRAVLGLLYGIEERTSDDYVHDRTSLRIGARLEDAAGGELALVRRKGKKDTLLDERGQPLDETLLAKLLGPVSEAQYRSMFGLDHERLRLGGEQLRLGKGDLGESLFQAGTGAANVQRVLAALDQEAEALWKPRGQRPINAAIAAYDEARKQVREHSKRADLFRAQEEQLEHKRRESHELAERRRTLLEEQSRLERVLRVLPALAKRRELRQRREALGPVALLPEYAVDERRAAQAELLACKAQAEQLSRQRAQSEQRLASLSVPLTLAALSPELVRGVRNRLGNHVKAGEDLPRRRAELRRLEIELGAALHALGSELPPERAERLRIDVATETRINHLAGEHSGLLERVAAAERDLTSAERDFGAALAELRALPAREGARLEPSGVAALALPAPQAVTPFRERTEAMQRKRAEHAAARVRVGEREERVLVELDALAREGAPPTEQDLGEARAARDAALLELERAFDRGGSRSGPSAELRALVKRSDELADRLRREANRVTRLAQLLAERDAVARELARLEQAETDLAREQAAIEHEFRALFLPLGIEPSSPAEMQLLLGRVAGLLEQSARGRREAEARKREARARLARWEAEWGELMAKLGLRVSASVEEAMAVLAQLRRLLEIDADRRQLQGRIEGMERDAREFARQVAELVAAHLPELGSSALEHAAEQLVQRYAQAQRDLEQKQRLEADLHDAGAEREALEARAAEAQRKLEGLLHAAHAADIAALEDAERNSTLARDLDQRSAEAEEELLAQGEGESIEALEARSAQMPADRVRARLTEVKEELELLNQDHAKAVHEVGAIEAGLDFLRSDDGSAEAAAEAEQHLSQLKRDAHSYVTKKLAAQLLRREIARYRERNQGPIVRDAGAIFARLTLGRYARLSVDYDDKDALVLCCVPESGGRVAVEQLSDGARDQLYLALRLASLKLFAEKSEPMPLLLDDVLIHFDDERASAALAVLGELSEVTQILFFTHHARIAELARAAVPEGRLVEHRLGGERPRIDAASAR